MGLTPRGEYGVGGAVEHHPLSFTALRNDMRARPGAYALFIVSMNIIGTSGTVTLWGAVGEFPPVVFIRIWFASLFANVVFVWASAMTFRCLMLLNRVQWRYRIMSHPVMWIAAPVMILLSWILSWNVLCLSGNNVDFVLEGGFALDFAWSVTFLTSLPIEPDGDSASYVAFAWVSVPFATFVAMMITYGNSEMVPDQKAQASSTS